MTDDEPSIQSLLERETAMMDARHRQSMRESIPKLIVIALLFFLVVYFGGSFGL